MISIIVSLFQTPFFAASSNGGIVILILIILIKLISVIINAVKEKNKRSQESQSASPARQVIRSSPPDQRPKSDLEELLNALGVPSSQAPPEPSTPISQPPIIGSSLNKKKPIHEEEEEFDDEEVAPHSIFEKKKKLISASSALSEVSTPNTFSTSNSIRLSNQPAFKSQITESFDRIERDRAVSEPQIQETIKKISPSSSVSRTSLRSLFQDKASLRRAILVQEILSPPLGLR